MTIPVCPGCGQTGVMTHPDVRECVCGYFPDGSLPVFSYTENYHAYRPMRWFSPKTFLLGKKLLKLLWSMRFQGKTLLDVGCGSGHVMRLAKLLGYRVYGFDLPHVKLDGHIIYSDWDILLSCFSGTFDIVTCWHTIEHVDDPRDFLSKLKRCLNMDGVLSLEMPDADLLHVAWLMQGKQRFSSLLEFPEHRFIPHQKWMVNHLNDLKEVTTFVPYDGAFYSLFFKACTNADNKEQVKAQEPGRFKQLIGCVLSALLEPFAKQMVTPLARHYVYRKV